MGNSAVQVEGWDDSALALVGLTRRGIGAMHWSLMDYLHEEVLRQANDVHIVASAGRERMIRYGGSGTPAVPEFAVVSIQAEIGEAAWYAQQLVADTMSLVYRLRRIFSVLHDGAVSVERARMVASATRDLSLDAVAQVQDHLMVGRPQHTPLLARIT